MDQLRLKHNLYFRVNIPIYCAAYILDQYTNWVVYILGLQGRPEDRFIEVPYYTTFNTFINRGCGIKFTINHDNLRKIIDKDLSSDKDYLLYNY